MRTTRLATVLVISMWAATSAFGQSGTIVYENDFDLPVGREWSDDRRASTPIGNDQYLGRFGGEPVALDLVDLPEHCAVTVSFELYVIGSWDGSVGSRAGADVFDVNASVPGDCCPVENLLHTTFANCDCKFQAYPDTYPNVHRPGLTGAAEIGSLGYDADSVYDLTFTFFHDRSELRLTFAGSPNLEDLSNESWGIDNIVVTIDDESCCRATRILPAAFNAGDTVDVEIVVTPNAGVESHTVVEDPPFSFNVFNINEAGVFDGEFVTWGPYFVDTPRTLSYRTRVADWVDGPISFDGTITVDGTDEAVCGDRTIAPVSMHPADVDADGRIDAGEADAYAEAWKRGERWPIGSGEIPASWVTNAGALWQAGEAYRYDDTAEPPWVSDVAAKREAGGEVTVRYPGSYRVDRAMPVAVSVRPQAGTLAWTLEQVLPDGFAVEGLDATGGTFDAAARTLVWGPYFDDAPQTIRYSLSHVEGTPAAVKISGTATFDGVGADASGLRDAIPTTAQRRVSN